MSLSVSEPFLPLSYVTEFSLQKFHNVRLSVLFTPLNKALTLYGSDHQTGLVIRPVS